ncbi:MAG: DUF1684 domain-containing protein [Verrucomicrobiales bacterium]|nr:DUF1684 domain-containing protein [Verrucomicrobiales bacterium]
MSPHNSGALALLAASLLLGAGCATPSSDPPDWVTWKARRTESLAGTNGWTTLVGLHWLKEGTNSAGSAPTNDVLLPAGRSAPEIGQFIRTGDSVQFIASSGIDAHVEGRPVTRTSLVSDHTPPPSLLEVGPLSIIVIERSGRIGLRIRDPESPWRKNFKAPECFPYSPSWRIEGRYDPFPSPRTLRVPSMIGGTQDFPSPGALVFRHDGAEYRLDVAVEPGESDYFVMFRDATAGRTTYGSGRFLYVSPPDASGRVILDFNRAYTPPCGFTPFATCPLPPTQNRLPFPIPAGEKAPEGHP